MQPRKKRKRPPVAPAGKTVGAEVAEKLGLSHEQVWYRYHRACREAQAIGLACAHGQRVPQTHDHAPHEKTGKEEKSAQGTAVFSVSRKGV